MTDPAVVAAQRAAQSGPYAGCCKAYANAAAREALKPIREVLDKLAADTEPPCNYATQIELFEKAISDISGLAFATEEQSDDPCP